MIKFFYFILLSLFTLGVSSYGVWLVNGAWVFVLFCLLINASGLTDFLILTNDFWVDTISFRLVVLRLWVTIIILFSRERIYVRKNFVIYFFLMVRLLLLFLVLAFIRINILTFYFFFEVSLIPTLLIILGWGYQPERLQAGIYFLFYTLTASLPLLIVLLFYYRCSGSLSIIILQPAYFSKLRRILLFLGLRIAFLAKLPIFFVHLWLPKAHVEAPVAGSMILAGVLLKLGGYGLFRVAVLLLNTLKWVNYLFGVRLIGIIYVGLICCRLNDLKALVAYSSVAHIAIVVCGIFRFYTWGLGGALIIIISHGLSSSGLFCIVNIYYRNRGRRSFYLNKGIIRLCSMYTLFFFLLCAANIAAPPTINLLSEIFLMASIIKYDLVMLLAFPVGSYLGAIFTLFLFSYRQHGRGLNTSYSSFMRSFCDFHLLVMHVIPINFFILKIDFYL